MINFVHKYGYFILYQIMERNIYILIMPSVITCTRFEIYFSFGALTSTMIFRPCIIIAL